MRETPSFCQSINEQRAVHEKRAVHEERNAFPLYRVSDSVDPTRLAVDLCCRGPRL